MRRLGWSSRTIVPASVPSLRHRGPTPEPNALKYRMPPSAVSHIGYELSDPGCRSDTMPVPLDAPSDTHSSKPWAGS
jgi:hypothetical protein